MLVLDVYLVRCVVDVALAVGECRLGRPEVTFPVPHTALRRPASGWGYPQSSASRIGARVITTCGYSSGKVP